MTRKIIYLSIFVFINILFVGNARALDLEYKEYIIQKGDTLWDISAAELQDPFLWPNIWKENPDISNPDLIYPDQHVRIPVYMLQKQVRLAPPPVEPPPVDVSVSEEIPDTVTEVVEEIIVEEEEKEEVVHRNLVVISGFIVPDVPSVGALKSAPTNRKILGKYDEAYAEIEGDKSPGRKFYTFRKPVKWRKVKHPKGGTVGYLIEITGIAELIGEELGNPKIVINESFLDINVDETYGDQLMDYFEIEPPMIADHPRKPDIKGTIVMTRDLRVLNAEHDVVYIDKGDADGVVPGDEFDIISQDYPQIAIGKMIVILTKNNTATAYITKSTDVVERGDTF